MALFKLSDLYDKPILYQWHVDVDSLAKSISAKLQKTLTEYADLCKPHVESVNKIRSILYKMNTYDAAFPEATVQKLMNLLLNSVVPQYGFNAHAINSLPIEFIAKDSSESLTTWKGRSDLGIAPTADVDIAMHHILMEMKCPFDPQSLFRSKASRCKQQVLAQLLGVLQMRSNVNNTYSSAKVLKESPFTIAYFTDIFAIGFQLHFEDVIYVTDRVTDASHFITMLLFMVFEWSSEELRAILPQDRAPVVISDNEEDEDEVEDERKERSKGSKKSRKRDRSNLSKDAKTSTASSASRRSAKGGKFKTACFDYEAECEWEQRQKDLRDLLRWDARVNCKFMCPFYEDMVVHNSNVMERQLHV